MAAGKLGQRRQVVIPKDICEQLGLRVGDFVEVEAERGTVVIKPKKLVDADLVLTPEEEAVVRKGREQLRRGASVSLEELEHELDGQALQGGRKTTPRNTR
jgi:AbrB family looped-hinge helix DNA binding protein